MEILADSVFEVFDAAAGALLLYAWDQDTVRATDTTVLTVHGFNERTTALALLSELLFLMDREDRVFKRFRTESFSLLEGGEAVKRRQYRLTGTAVGEPKDAGRHLMLNPVRAVLLEGLKWKQSGSTIRFYCLLDT